MKPELVCFAACACLIAPLRLPAQESDFAYRFAASQRLAVIRFPALAKADSEINQRFIAEYTRLKASDAPLLRNPMWPAHLAQRCAEDLGMVKALSPLQASQRPLQAPQRPAWMSQSVSSLSTGSLSTGSLSTNSLPKTETSSEPVVSSKTVDEPAQPDAASPADLFRRYIATISALLEPQESQKPAPAESNTSSPLKTGSLQIGHL